MPSAVASLLRAILPAATLLAWLCCALPCAAELWQLQVYDGSSSGTTTRNVAGGTAVTVTASIPLNKGFLGWRTHTGLELTDEQIASPSLAFTMPENDVKLGAAFGAIVFAAGETVLDIPGYMASQPQLTLPADADEGTFAVDANTTWTIRATLDPTATPPTDGSADPNLPAWLTILNGGGYGPAEVRFRTETYAPPAATGTTSTGTAAQEPRVAYLILQPAATTISPITVAVTQLASTAQPGFYYDLWNNAATLNLFVPPAEGYSSLDIPATTDDGRTVAAIGSRPFQGSDSLEAVTLSRGITVIHESAFKDCAALTSVQLPVTLKDIRADAFSGCKALETLALESTDLKYIRDRAFAACTGLASLDFPNSLLLIGDEAFSRCTSLELGMLPRHLESIGDAAFVQCATSAFTVSAYNETYRATDGVLFLKKPRTLLAYPYAASATHYAIPADTLSIAPSAFAHARFLKTVSFSDATNLTDIGEAAFLDDTALTHIQLPLAIETIGSRAFGGCTSLQSIVASATAPTIASDAFDGCTQLTRFYFYGEKPAFDSALPLSPASNTTIYACRELGWTNGETFAGCAVAAAPQTSFYACVVDNGIPNAYFVDGWPVTALAFPDGINVFYKWASVSGVTFTQEQLAENPVTFTMPGNSGVALQASYVHPSYTLTLYHAKLSTGSAGGSIPAATPLRAVADMPSGVAFSCWASDTHPISGTAATRYYIDFLMPYADTTLYAATTSPDIRRALGYEGKFTTYGDTFWQQNTSQYRSTPGAASSSGKHSILATTATGPVNLAFFGKLTAPSTSRASLVCRIDSLETDTRLTALNGDWRPFSLQVPEGEHTIEWLLENPDADATAVIDNVQAFAAGKTRKLTVRNSSGSGDYEAGTVVALTADSCPGLGFTSWDAAFLDYSPAELANPTIAFIMPDNDATIVAYYDTAHLAIAPEDETARADENASVMLPATSGDTPLVIDANSPWTATPSAPWLSITPSSAVADASIILAVTANSSSAPRSATVHFEAESGLVLDLAVIQQPSNYTGFFHDVWDDSAVITAFVHDGSDDPVAIPSTLDGATVTRLADGIFRNSPNITAFDAADDHAVVRTRDGILYSTDMTTLLAYPPASPAQAVTLPDTVSAIADGAFANARYLQTLTLPDAITPAIFQTHAFDDCTDAISAFATTPAHSTMAASDGVLFSLDRTTLYAYPPGRSDCAYTIPDGTAAIASCAFKNARSLNMLTFPQSIAALDGTPFIGLDDCLRFLVFHGPLPSFASEPPPNAIIYIHPETLPENAWENALGKFGNDYEYIQDGASLELVSVPEFISYDGQFSIYLEVATTAAQWRVYRFSLGADDAVWMPCDTTTDAAWLNLDWELEAYPVNRSDSNRVQTLWFTAEGCIPQVAAITQLCRQDTFNQNLASLPCGWNTLTILCTPFQDTVQPIINLGPFIFDKRHLAYRRALLSDVTAGTQLWLYVTPETSRLLPYISLIGQKVHSQSLPDTYGWHAFGTALPDGFTPESWNTLFDSAWRWDGNAFILVSPDEALDYGNSYFLHKH